MPLILPGNVGSATAATGFNVANSVRFDSGDSPYLFKSNASGNSDMTKFTASFWFKKAKPVVTNGGGLFMIKSATSDANDKFHIYLMDDQMHCTIFDSSGSTEGNIKPNRVFRDPAAWVHVTYRYDSTQGTDSNRTRLYINGVQETSLGTANYPDQNHAQPIDNSTEMALGRVTYNNGSHYEFDGYMAEIVLLDGVSADPTSFGEFDSDSGIWKPIDVSGLTFGTNGFYLDFEDSSALGNDAAGSNNFTVNNLTAIDQSTDTCTNNFATLNPLATNTNTGSSNFSEGSLELDRPGSTSSWVGCINTMGVTQGKWYAEYKVIDAGDPQNGVMIGVTNVDLSNFQNAGNDLSQSGEFGINYYAGGTIANNGSNIATYTAMSDGDIVMIALDIDNGKIYWGRNGTWENSGVPTSGSTGTGAQNLSVITTGDTYCFHLCCREDGNVQANYGSPPYAISSGNTDGNGYGNFEYAVPSGYYSLNTKNLAEYG